MTTQQVSAADARHELARRKLDKASVAYQDRRAGWNLPKAELVALAAKRTTRKAPAASTPVAPERTVDPHTALRKMAWQLRMDARKVGIKLSYADACAKVGTTPARKVA